jgi:hypothetical protein
MKTELTCPLGSVCEEPKEGLIRKCRWFVTILGKHPQTGKDVEESGCAMQFMPLLQIEVAQTNRGQTQALESFRNEMVKSQAIFNSLLGAAKELKG